MHFLSECRDFLRETRRKYRNTGSVMPSSRFLGRALATQLRKDRGPCRILEVGPGTGAVTAQIARYLRPGDRLDAIEINERFVEIVRQRVNGEAAFAGCRDQVRVLHGPLESLPERGVYDVIISGLPLNNFPVAEVRAIFRAYRRLLKPGGTLSYFEYTFIRQLKTPFVGKGERRRLAGVGRVVETYIKSCQVDRQHVLMNVPPAIVRHLRLQPAQPAQPVA